MATAANHLDNIVLNLSLQAAPGSIASFSIEAFVRSGITLGGDRIRTYTTLDAVVADEAAGDVDATVTAAATVVFSQLPTPASWKVIRHTGPETYVDAITAAYVIDCSFYIVAIDDRTLAIAALVSTYVEAQPRMLFVPQSADAGWLSAGVPAAFAAYTGKERTALLYHDTDTEWASEGWAAARATFDPDTQSAPWDGRARGVAALATAPTDTEKLNLDNNRANHGLAYRSATFFVDAGVNGAGRPIHEIVSLDWFATRLVEAVADLKLKYSDEGQKIPVNEAGQAIILGEIDGLLQAGITAKHFNAGQTSAEGIAIDGNDLSLSRLRFQIRGQFAGSARLFTFNVNFTRDPINA